MIELEEAFEIIRRVQPRTSIQTVPLEEASGRALAHEVKSPIDSPPFTRSAMDGFAIRAGDASVSERDAGDLELSQDFRAEQPGVVLAELLSQRLLVLVEADPHAAKV